MVHHRHGYKHTAVSGTEFTIKHSMEGSREDVVGRRLAAYNDEITGVEVEYDGVITAHVRADGRWNISDYLPEDFTAVDAMVHPSSGGAHAHIDIERDE